MLERATSLIYHKKLILALIYRCENIITRLLPIKVVTQITANATNGSHHLNLFAGGFEQEGHAKVQVCPLRPVGREQREGERREEKSTRHRQEHGERCRLFQLPTKRLGREGLHGRAEGEGQAGLSLMRLPEPTYLSGQMHLNLCCVQFVSSVQIFQVDVIQVASATKTNISFI